MSIDVGRLNKRITFYEPIKGKDELGLTRTTLSEIKTVWASVEPTNGREYYEAQKVRSELIWNIFIRYTRSFRPTNDMVIDYNGRKFEIQSIIDNKEEHELYKFVCIERFD